MRSNSSLGIRPCKGKCILGEPEGQEVFKDEIKKLAITKTQSKTLISS